MSSSRRISISIASSRCVDCSAWPVAALRVARGTSFQSSSGGCTAPSPDPRIVCGEPWRLRRTAVLDLRESDETCSKCRVARLMRINNIRARYGYRTKHSSTAKPSTLTQNVLERNFNVSSLNMAWVGSARRNSKRRLNEIGAVSPKPWELHLAYSSSASVNTNASRLPGRCTE